MNKKVLAISSSPRRGGNSDLLCDQFLAGAREAGNHTEKLFLKDKTIHYCTGCGSCFSRGKGCTQKDDMGEVLERMIAADVIVMATPVYFYTMCGQMKTLIDRTCARYTEVSDKQFYFIMTAANGDENAMGRTLEEFRAFTSCLKGAREMGVVRGAGAGNIGDIRKSPTMQQAYDMGKRCA